MTETYAKRNEILNELGFKDYGLYLESDLWISIRKRVIELRGNRCVICAQEASETHHLSYTREVLLGEDLEKLVRLCGRCHYKLEFDKSGVKRTFAEVSAVFKQRTRPKGSRRCKLCGNIIGKRSSICRSCNGTGIAKHPTSRRAARFLDKQK